MLLAGMEVLAGRDRQRSNNKTLLTQVTPLFKALGFIQACTVNETKHLVSYTQGGMDHSLGG